jgi:arginine/lysine/ornithine decarboxylase
LDQNTAPVLDAIAEYHRLDRYGFTPPGHKQGRGADPQVLDVLGAAPFRDDLLASGGLDDRKSSRGIIEQAQELMADAVGAQHAFFSTCGSSLSVKSAMLAVAGTDGDFIIGRDAHKSVVAGVILAGFHPRWVHPRWDAEHHLAHPPGPADYEKALQEYPDAAGVLVTSPSPYGTCADLAEIARACHAHGKPLVVDEAWGAHLPFHDDLPTWAMEADADLCVVSVHKMGAGFEQGSIFHLQGDRIDPAHLRQCADLLATTSPNVMLYAAMDGWRRQMVQHGRQLLGDALTLARNTRQALDELPGVSVLEDRLLGAEASHDLDRLQILLDLHGLGISGFQAADWLRDNARLDAHLPDQRHLSFQITFADDSATTDRLLEAMRRLVDADLPAPPEVHLPRPADLELEQVRSPRDAFFGPAEQVPASAAAGRVAAEQITPYPPGVPTVLPGERITAEVLDYLRSGLAAGMTIPDAADGRLETVRVTAPG